MKNTLRGDTLELRLLLESAYHSCQPSILSVCGMTLRLAMKMGDMKSKWVGR